MRAIPMAALLALALVAPAFAQDDVIAGQIADTVTPLLPAAWHPWIMVGLSVIAFAKLVVATTNTPDPSTPAGKAYRVLEILALVFGKMKDTGTGKTMIALFVAIGLGCMVGACTTAAVTTPAQQSVAAGVANFQPAVTGIVGKLNSGIAAAQPDLLMVCGAMSYLDTLYKMTAPAVGASAADNQSETLAMAAVNAVCNHPPSDVGTAVASVLSAYRTVSAQLQVAAPAIATQAALTPAGA